MTRLVALLCAVMAVGIGGYFVLGASGTNTTQISPFVSAANAQDSSEIDISTVEEMTLGAEDAPVTMIEYASFTCPHCANFHQNIFKDIKKNYIDTGKVKLVYREVYFDKYGLWASLIARCGGADKFFGIADLMYKSQAEWVRAGGAPEIAGELRKIARLAGVDKETLDQCLSDGQQAQTMVAWYQHHAEADDITGTPSFILNGEKIANQGSYEAFAKLIDAELEK